MIAPTLSEIRLNLVEGEVTSSGMEGCVTWLVEGISIENAQYVYSDLTVNCYELLIFL
jgi:hypothetical protein